MPTQPDKSEVQKKPPLLNQLASLHAGIETSRSDATEEKREDLRDSLAKAALAKKLADQVLKDSTLVSPTPEAVRSASRDPKKAEAFETVAFIIAAIGGALAESYRKTLLAPQDEPHKDDITSQEALKKELARLAAATPAPAATAEKKPMTLRETIVQAAYALVGSLGFRDKKVDGGNLACAQVATTALKNAGMVEKENLSVPSTVQMLKKKGWTEKKGEPEPGDVVVWDRVKRGDADGTVALGYGHIGICVSPGRAVNNSSFERLPIVGNVKKRQGVTVVLSPPEKSANA